MSPLRGNREETTQVVVFPALGHEAAFVASKERLGAYLRQEFPGFEFEMSDTGLYEEASVLPICGSVGGEDARILAPPPVSTLQAIEAALNAFDPARTGLS